MIHNIFLGYNYFDKIQNNECKIVMRLAEMGWVISQASECQQVFK